MQISGALSSHVATCRESRCQGCLCCFSMVEYEEAANITQSQGNVQAYVCRRQSNQLQTSSQAKVRHGKQSMSASIKAALASTALSDKNLKAAMHMSWQAYTQQLLTQSPDKSSKLELQKRAESCACEGGLIDVAASQHAQHIGVTGTVFQVSKLLLHLVTDTSRILHVHLPGAHVQLRLPPGVMHKGLPFLLLRGRHDALECTQPMVHKWFDDRPHW